MRVCVCLSLKFKLWNYELFWRQIPDYRRVSITKKWNSINLGFFANFILFTIIVILLQRWKFLLLSLHLGKNIEINSSFAWMFQYRIKKLLGLDQVYYWRYNGENIFIYLNIDVGLFGSHSHVIIKTQKVDPRAEGGARILIKESDGDVSSLEKSLTDKCVTMLTLKVWEDTAIHKINVLICLFVT